MKKFQAGRSVSHPQLTPSVESVWPFLVRADFFSADKTLKMQLSSPGNEQVAYTTITRWLTESCRPLITQQRHGRRRHQAESTGNSCACVSHFYIWPVVLDTCHFQLTESIAFLLFFSSSSVPRLLLSCSPPAKSILPVPFSHGRNGHVMPVIQRSRSIPLFIYFALLFTRPIGPHLHFIISATVGLTNYSAD
jgi:hypothetical protein